MALVNLVRVVSATTGTGALTLGLKVQGFLNMVEADAVDGETYSYAIEADYVSSVATSREIGTGVWDSGGNTLTRNVINSTNSDALLNLAGDEQVIITPNAADFLGRENVPANRTYYVRTDGSDSNTGLADNAGGAFLTIQRAIDVVIDTLIINLGVTVTIQVRTGTYDEQPTISQWIGPGFLTLLGDAATPSNVVIKPTSFAVSSGVVNFHEVVGVSLQGFTLDATDAGFGGFAPLFVRRSNGFLNSVVFKTVTDDVWFGILVSSFSSISGSDWTFDAPGDQASAVLAEGPSCYVSCFGNLDITSTTTYANGVLAADNDSAIVITNRSGGDAGVTGSRFRLNTRSVLLSQINGIGSAALPGSTEGTMDASSFYQDEYGGVVSGGMIQYAGVPDTGVLSIDRAQSIIRDTTNNTTGLYTNEAGIIKHTFIGNYRVSRTADLTLVVGSDGMTYDNTGASGTVILTLPTIVSATLGTRFSFCCTVAQILRVLAPASTSIAIGASNSAAAGNVQSNAPFSFVEIEAVSTTQWVARGMTGSWTVT